MIWMTDLSGFAASQLILHEINNRKIAIFFNTRRQWKSRLPWSRNSSGAALATYAGSAQRNPAVGEIPARLIQSSGNGLGQRANLVRLESLQIVEQHPGVFPAVRHAQRNPAW